MCVCVLKGQLNTSSTFLETRKYEFQVSLNEKFTWSSCINFYLCYRSRIIIGVLRNILKVYFLKILNFNTHVIIY